jgi:hypothetical protein
VTLESLTDALITVLEDAIRYLKESRGSREDPSKLHEIICHAEATIREVRRAERENAVMVKRQPPGMRIDGWDV